MSIIFTEGSSANSWHLPFMRGSVFVQMSGPLLTTRAEVRTVDKPFPSNRRPRSFPTSAIHSSTGSQKSSLFEINPHHDMQILLGSLRISSQLSSIFKCSVDIVYRARAVRMSDQTLSAIAQR
jgi:hypothetical protein